MNTDELNNKSQNPEPEFDELTNDPLLSGHEYDGIRELDNDLPPWWKYLFFITIVFAVVFLLVYHVFKLAPLQYAKYDQEMAAAETKYKNTESTISKSTIVAVTDEGSLTDGKATFDKICSVCHGKYGQGIVGPNFTDDYWIHGGTIGDMYQVVITGVPEKGMISYESQLSPEKIRNVLSYIITLRGTNPSNPKAPEGVLYKDGKPVTDAADSTDN